MIECRISILSRLVSRGFLVVGKGVGILWMSALMTAVEDGRADVGRVDELEFGTMWLAMVSFGDGVTDVFG